MERIFRAVVTLLLAALAAPSSAAAQIILDLARDGADQIWTAPQAGAWSGFWLDQGAVGGGDSRRDLIVGAPGSPDSGLVGAVYIIYGGRVRTGRLSLAESDVVITGGAAGDRFGFATAAGHVLVRESNDLARNLLVGAPGAAAGRGAVYLFTGGFGTSARPSASDATLVITGAPGDQLGSALATGDMDGDGYREMILGAPGTGRIYIIRGGASLAGSRDLTTQPADRTLSGPGYGSILTAGDLNGDGRYELAVGLPDANAVHVYVPSGAAFPATPTAMFTGAAAGDRAGAALAVGNFDNDAYRDLAIGAPGGDGPNEGRTDAGEAYIVWGSAAFGAGGTLSPGVVIYGAAPGLGTGTAVTTGDVNRDPQNDLVLLAPGGSNGAGEILVYHGRARAGMGAALPDGRRSVDFALGGQISRSIWGDPAAGSVRVLQVFEVTGEGARDIIAGVPTAEGTAGRVYFSISPRLKLSTRSLSFIAAEGSSASASFTVTNPSPVAITWNISSTADWLGGSPASGPASAGQVGSTTIVAAANSLPPGTHAASFTVASTSEHLEMALPVDVTFTVSGPRFIVDAPRDGTSVVQPISIGGWAADIGAATGTGVDAVHIYAYPNPGSGAAAIFLGTASYGANRPDVGTAFGNRFALAGFGLPATGLAPGRYQIVAYARSTVTGSFSMSRSVTVTLEAQPRMALDAPAGGSTVDSGFSVAGWAIDLASASGTGVDAVHAYAYPASGAPPIFLGVASYGIARPDIGTAAGTQFTNSGYQLSVSGLAPGGYQIVVHARSTVTGTFATSAVAGITVRDTTPAPEPPPSPSPSPSPTQITVNRTQLRFGVLRAGGAVQRVTSGQEVLLTQSGGGGARWNVSGNQPWIQVTPSAGTGAGMFTVRLDPAGGLPMSGEAEGTVSVASADATNSPLTLSVRVRLYDGQDPGASSAARPRAPIGFFDTPVDNAQDVTGAIPVTGWAIDDIEVARVELWRDPVNGEPVSPDNGKVYIGNAILLEDTRPDVEAAFPGYPLSYRAGWGLMVLTNMMPDVPARRPHGGNGTFVLYAYAYDAEGHVTPLGAKRITCTNATATRPFGTIDTPPQGGLISGQYVNFGWVLAPQPNFIPGDGSTLEVYIDGVSVGHPVYNNYREDIATAFPGYGNSTGAIGYYFIDTTRLSNGLHTISWVVRDNVGNVNGIGSRFFRVLNADTTSALTAAATSTTTTASEPVPETSDPATASAPAVTESSMTIGQTAEPDLAVSGDPVMLQAGANVDAPTQFVVPDGDGLVRATIPELGRLELALGAAAGYEGFLEVGGERRALPAGSTLDAGAGTFYWQPGAGFLGRYDLRFVRLRADGTRESVPVEVTVTPATRSERQPRIRQR